MITPLVVLSWVIYGMVILFLIGIWYILMYVIFGNRKMNTVISPTVFFLWFIPVSLFLGFLVYFAAKYLFLLGLVK